MNLQTAVAVVILTTLAGLADAQGFVHAGRVWTTTGIDYVAALLATIGFTSSVPCYLFAIRFLTAGGVHAVEIQTACWFVATMVGVAIAGGNFLRWNIADQAVALVVVGGVIWLVMRTG